MEKTEEYKRSDDRARLLTKLAAAGGCFALVLLIAVLILAAKRGGDVLGLAALPFAAALLFSFSALIYGILYGGVQREEEEKALLAKRMESRALNVEEDVRFTAGRTFANYSRFAPFVISVAAVVLVALMLWSNFSTWKLRGGAPVVMTGSPVHTALITAVLMMVAVFTGAFMVGQSRMSGFRWLRPVGAWLLMGFVTLAGASVSALFFGSNITEVDPVAAKVFFWIFAVLGAEFIVNFVIEFYRPRTVGESRPVFESQLLSLFTEPGGVLRNIASALDYQFGFKVSGTWIYGFIERSFFPVLILWALLLWGFTAVHEIGPDQVGVRECFGEVTSEKPLQPGIYLSLPYPFGTVRLFSCTEVKRIVIGETPETAEKRASASVVLWTNEHGSAKEPFIVAVREPDGKSSGQESSSISFVNMAIPIEFRIREDGVMNFAYDNAAPVATLKKIGEQAVVEFLAGASMEKLMSYGRSEAERELKVRVQRLADANSLGVEIIRVALMDAHPPVEQVAPAYQNVIASVEEKQTEILRAKAYQATVLPEAKARAMEISSLAKGAAYRTRTVAAAESARFAAQLTAFSRMKSMFMLNAKMEVLESSGAGIRKFIIPAALAGEVYQMNFETRERLDLVDIDVSELSDKTMKK